MKNWSLTLTVIISLFSVSAFASDKEHDDKEHVQAEKDLGHPHWEKAHGSGVPDKQPVRKPPTSISK